MNEMPFKAAKTSSSGTAVAPPCVFVIFGASGDLTKRLLMPAIYNLVNEGLLNEDFAILGINRGDDNEDAFRKNLLRSMTEIIESGASEAGKDKLDESATAWLHDRLFHLRGDITDDKMFSELLHKIEELTRHKAHKNVFFYMATSE